MFLSTRLVPIGGALTIVFGVANSAEANKNHPLCNDLQGVGMASWYGEEVGREVSDGVYEYNPTANGEEFNPNYVSAAHKTLKLGTYILVERLDNGQSLIMKVNDRGPYAKGRILDVSRRAAEILGFKDSGEKRVAIYTCDM